MITVEGVPDSNLPYSRKSRKSQIIQGRRMKQGGMRCKTGCFAPGTGYGCNSMGMSENIIYIMKTETSMAAPLSRDADCLLSKYPDMTNVEIKLKVQR